MDQVHEAAATFFAAGGPAAFLLDFGACESGRTVLVEANEGYACGAYGLNPLAYAAVLITRWTEIAQGREAALAIP